MIIRNSDGTWSFDENAAIKAILDNVADMMTGFVIAESPECIDEYTKIFKAYIDLIASIRAFTSAVNGNCPSV